MTDATTLVYKLPAAVEFLCDERAAEEFSWENYRPSAESVVTSPIDIDSVTSTYSASDPSIEFATHFEKLKAITNTPSLLPEDAEAPSEAAHNWALVALQQFQEDELAPTRVVASAEGGIAICFVRGDKYADLECLNTGEILAVTSNRYNRPTVWEIRESSHEMSRASARICRFLDD